VPSAKRRAAATSPPERPRARRRLEPQSRYNSYVHDSTHPERFLVVEPRGARDLHAAFLRLALGLSDTPHKDTLWLVAPGLSGGRVFSEWLRFRDVLTDSLKRRVKLVALAGPDLVTYPDLPKREAEAARAYLMARVRRSPIAGDLEHTPLSRKFFDVWKVLVNAWFRAEGPLPLGELARRAGVSSPTLGQALDRLRRRGELALSRNRPVGLVHFPRTTLREIVALSESLRRPVAYVDASGRAPEPLRLLRDLGLRSVAGVAVGGIVAGRVYDPTFNMNGLPRLDVVAAETAGDGWIKDLDPALTVSTSPAVSPVLVVHPVRFAQQNPGLPGKPSVPVADPAETLLDLYELRLTDQAEAMIARREASGS